MNTIKNQRKEIIANFKITSCGTDDLNIFEELVRADEKAKVLDEIAEAFNEHLFDSPMMNPAMTRNEILLFLEQLKNQKGGAE